MPFANSPALARGLCTDSEGRNFPCRWCGDLRPMAHACLWQVMNWPESFSPSPFECRKFCARRRLQQLAGLSYNVTAGGQTPKSGGNTIGHPAARQNINCYIFNSKLCLQLLRKTLYFLEILFRFAHYTRAVAMPERPFAHTPSRFAGQARPHQQNPPTTLHSHSGAGRGRCPKCIDVRVAG